MEQLNETLGGFIIVGGAIIIVFIVAKYTYLIKKLAMEKGVSSASGHKRFRYLELGAITLGLGIGLLVSSVYTLFDLSEGTSDLLIWGTILVFGGIGMICGHILRSRLEK